MNVEQRPPQPSQVPLWIVAVAVIVAELYVGRIFLVPIVFAVLLSIVCRPIVRWLHRRLHVPPAVSGALVVVVLVAAMAGASVTLAGPVRGWWDRAPENFAAAEERLRGLGEPLRQISALKTSLHHLGSATTGPASATTVPAVAPAIAPASNVPGIAEGLFGDVSEVLSGIAEVLFLAFLMLGSDGLFLRKLRGAIESEQGKQDAASVVHESESLILRYLLVTFVINLGQASVVGVTMWLLGVPHALLWAGLTVVLEFVPYLGAAAMVLFLSVTALATFDSIAHAALVPAAYLLISMVQNNVVSPLLYGNHLKLNAVAILIGVIFFWFVWGIPGAFVAVPILAIARIAAEKLDGCKALGQYLGD